MECEWELDKEKDLADKKEREYQDTADSSHRPRRRRLQTPEPTLSQASNSCTADSHRFSLPRNAHPRPVSRGRCVRFHFFSERILLHARSPSAKQRALKARHEWQRKTARRS